MKDNQLLNGAFIYFIVIIVGIIASGFIKVGKKYKTANQIVFERSINDDHLVKYIDFSMSNLDDYLFVDLRTEAKFNSSHIDGAINIMPEDILTKKSLKTMRKSTRQIVLYSESQAKSFSVSMLLHSAGVENIRVLAGNYELAKTNAIESSKLEMLRYDEEKVRWNYGAFFKTTPVDRNEPPITPVMLELQGGC